jgi:hypothetical protein
LYVFLIEKFSFTALRNPSKWLFFSTISLAVVAACAYDQLDSLQKNQVFLRRIKKCLTIFSGLVLLTPLFAQTAYRMLKAWLTDFAHRSAQSAYSGKKDQFHDISYYQARVEELLVQLEKIFSYLNAWNLIAIFFFLLSALLLWKGKKMAFIVLLAVDLIVYGTFLGNGFTGNARVYPEKLPEALVTEIRHRQALDGSAVIGWTDEKNQEALPANVNLLYSVNHAGGYSPLLLKRYYELTKELGIVDSSLGRRSYLEEVWKKESGVVQVAGISQILSERGLRDLETVLPFAWTVSDWKHIPDENERLSFLKSSEFRPAELAVIEKPVSNFERTPDVVLNPVRILSKSTTEIFLETDNSYDSLLVLRSAFYPRWKAGVDERPEPVIAANHAFSGVFLKKGTHRLRFYYDARPQRFYEILSMILYILLLAVVAILATRRWYSVPTRA